jgi:predicted transcriptional regulator
MIKLFDSELRVMEPLWKSGELSASQIAGLLDADIGWSRTTTYTIIKKCIEKGAIIRREPGFICRPAISKEEVRKQETAEFINKLFDGSTELFLASFVNEENLSKEQLKKLRALVDELS